MERNRIQKLLLSEYCEFSDTVLLESPFAETTRDGRGLREVALGLTPSRLIIAADVLKNNSEFTCPPDLDPSIESFELVSVYPLEFVTLSVFRRRRRRTLKARLIDGRAKYYELGGMECRSVYWALWCEHARDLLSKNEKGSSLSETTAATSSSTSTLCLLSSGVEFSKSVKSTRGSRSTCRVWAHYGGGGDGQSACWPRKDVYLGPSYNELSHGYYTPVPVRFAGASLEDLNYEFKNLTANQLTCKKTCSSWPCGRSFKSQGRKEKFDHGGALCDVLFTREHKTHKRSPLKRRNDEKYFEELINRPQRVTASETPQVLRSRLKNFCSSRHGQKRRSGSPKKLVSSLAPKLSRFGFGVRENCSSGLYLEPWEGDREHFRRSRPGRVKVNPRKLIESGVSVWESQSGLRKRLKHPRRYGLASAAHFLHALGPWSVQPGERDSVQRRRASSTVGIRRQPVEPELRLPVSKRQLAASVSLTSLQPGRSGAMGSSTRGRVVLFWTPEYWYRPRAAVAAYRELQRHLSLLRDFRIDKERSGRRKLFCRKKRSDHGDCRDSMSVVTVEERASCILGRIFSSKDTRRRVKEQNEGREGGTSQLKRLLRMDLRITAWDLDSTTIARQLTLIDRDLFLRIPCVEIEVLVFQRSSRNAPNLGAWIAFSHRISCLAASEILATKKLGTRTRLLSRLINAADKCYAIGNFHSCRSIVAGLQSPPIYRLRSTWSRLRTLHSTRYETMERLCKIFRSTSSRSYKRAWSRCERRPPILPYVGHLLARILGDPEEKSFSKAFDWKNRRCSSDAYWRDRRDKTECEKSYSKVTKNSSKEIDGVAENIAERRPSIGRRILSAAMMKIRSKKSSSPSLEESQRFISAAREKILARRVFERWRRFVRVARILAEREARLGGMDSRRRKVVEIGNWLTECQRHARGYNFQGHSLAWEFLLKARYREDRENFFVSLKLEPPCG